LPYSADDGTGGFLIDPGQRRGPSPAAPAGSSKW
jgi:hypothetical protein